MLKRWPARALRHVQWRTGPRTAFFVSYFFNLGKEQTAAGRFHSHQWEELPEHLRASGWQVNWLHHLLLTPAVSSARKAVEIAKGFNRALSDEGVHCYVESFLGMRLIGQALAEWWRAGRIARRIRPQLSFCPQGSRADLWSLLKDDWETSFRGPAGFSNSVTRRLFDRCLQETPCQAKGLYLWENQGWEAAFVHAWRRHGHGELIGVPHATVAFWHLNNYDDPMIFSATQVHSKPVPDCLAVNGPAARAMLVESGYPASRLTDVEALRFQYLTGLGVRQSPDPLHRESTIRLLLLGDFTRDQTLAMAKCLTQALNLIRAPIEITYRPHPVCDVGLDELGGVADSVSRKPLLEILHQYDWAFSSNSSSAGLDAYLGDLRVAVFLDDASLNHSPLRGESGVYFVNDHHALARLLEDNPVHLARTAGKYFWLSPRLTRWSRLINKQNEPTVAVRE
jgi:surface carbohydrate biosynthesis protein (TIGR04326 family)